MENTKEQKRKPSPLEYNMWDKRYQAARSRYHQARRNEQPDCCDNLVASMLTLVFKSCIHVFVLVILISFLGMAYVVSTSSPFDV